LVLSASMAWLYGDEVTAAIRTWFGCCSLVPHHSSDMRDAPSIPIIARLVQDGATVRAFDPKGMDQAKPLLPSESPSGDFIKDCIAFAT